jgi:phospholipid/cholesterol/gamma-HCH transport system permease protein
MVEKLGSQLILFLTELGNITILSGKVVHRMVVKKGYFKRTIDQMISLGIKSLPITMLTATFVGMAFTIQVVREFLRFGAGEMVGGIVGMAIWRELAPLLTGVVICGRVGAAISAELGTMNVTEQVEALESMSQDIVEYLVLPRILACTLMMPLLVGIADILGFLGGFLVALSTGRINPYSYFSSAEMMLGTLDIYGGLIKAFFFGLVVSLISSYIGLKTHGGAKGVGEATTKAVVISLIAVFVLNYFLSLVIY